MGVVISRRNILQAGAAGALNAFAFGGSAAAASQTRALLFDAFVIFDPRSIAAAIQPIAGDKSADFLRIWRSKQFEYTWLRNSGGVYKNFWDVTADALSYAEDNFGMHLAPADRQSLLQSYLKMKPWPDVAAGVSALRTKGLRLGILSNFTEEMLRANLENADGVDFDVLLSTDLVRRFKPDPLAYAMGETALKLRKEQITFVAFAGWDAVGATWYGYRTFWLNRSQAASEHLSVEIPATGARFDDLVTYTLG